MEIVEYQKYSQCIRKHVRKYAEKIFRRYPDFHYNLLVSQKQSELSNFHDEKQVTKRKTFDRILSKE